MGTDSHSCNPLIQDRKYSCPSEHLHQTFLPDDRVISNGFNDRSLTGATPSQSQDDMLRVHWSPIRPSCTERTAATIRNPRLTEASHIWSSPSGHFHHSFTLEP